MYRFIIKIYRDETLRAFFVVDLFFIVIKITPMENKSIKIRRATTKDIPELLVLLRELFSIEKDFTFRSELQERGLMTILDDQNALVLAAVEEGNARVLGMLTVQRHISTAEGGYVGVLEDMVIRVEYRGMGIARLLMNEALQWSRRNFFRRLQLVADRDNAPALEFYRKGGWCGTNLMALHRRM
jgi:ribosomal protein S18 acetylase RimI-like enzyme